MNYLLFVELEAYQLCFWLNFIYFLKLWILVPLFKKIQCLYRNKGKHGYLIVILLVFLVSYQVVLFRSKPVLKLQHFLGMCHSFWSPNVPATCPPPNWLKKSWIHLKIRSSIVKRLLIDYKSFCKSWIKKSFLHKIETGNFLLVIFLLLPKVNN